MLINIFTKITAFLTANGVNELWSPLLSVVVMILGAVCALKIFLVLIKWILS